MKVYFIPIRFNYSCADTSKADRNYDASKRTYWIYTGSFSIVLSRRGFLSHFL